MEHNSENLDHISGNHQPEVPQEYEKHPLSHRIISWILIAIVLFAFLGTCYWLAFYGRV